jgi:DNA-binding transcriptional LysR family regulator
VPAGNDVGSHLPGLDVRQGAGNQTKARLDLAAAASASGEFGPLRLLRVAFEQRGLPPPRIVLVTDLVMFKLRAVATSNLLGTAVRSNVLAATTRLDLKILPVKGLDWTRPVAVAYRKDAYLSPAARRFVDILKATAALGLLDALVERRISHHSGKGD